MHREEYYHDYPGKILAFRRYIVDTKQFKKTST